jgi:vancomycin permeability regulator SanA
MSPRPPAVADPPAGAADSGEHDAVTAGEVEPDATDPDTRTARHGGPAAPNRRRPSAIRRWSRRLLIAGATAGLVGVALLVAGNVYVTRSAEGLAFDDPAEVPERPTAIVFGAGVVNGQATPALADRVDGAVALYEQGRVSHLLMTGDNSRSDYDEVSVMRDLALAKGVPAEAITRDHAGFDTRSSCYRARDVFGVRAAVLVTQDYHLPRALYTCRDLGIDAVGLRVPDWQHNADQLDWGQYPGLDSRKYMTREWLARINALLEAHVTRPEPQFLGPYLGLGEG